MTATHQFDAVNMQQQLECSILRRVEFALKTVCIMLQNPKRPT